MPALVTAGLAGWCAILLWCWPIAALMLVSGASLVIGAGWWLHTWSERTAKEGKR
jgi:hypothetical protein